MIANYFFIDGSSLLSQIRELQKKKSSFKDRKLDPILFITHFTASLPDLQSNEYKRAVFYFPNEDENTVKKYLVVPNFAKPGLVRDLHFKYCGKKMKGSEAFNKFVDEKVPSRWRDRFQKSETGIDIEICCDAIKLASVGKMERLFMFTNDSDFVPLFKTLKEFGVNVSLIHLSELKGANKILTKEADSYDVIRDEVLERIFIPLTSSN